MISYNENEYNFFINNYYPLLFIINYYLLFYHKLSISKESNILNHHMF